MACVLCDTTTDLDRLCGFDLCAACRAGRLEPGLQKWGLQVYRHQWEEETLDKNGQVYFTHYFDLRIDLAAPIDARAYFRPETGLDRVLRAFRRAEPQGGDVVFDRAVFVAEAGGRHIQALVADEGVQSAILEVLTLAPCALTGTDLRATLTWDDDETDVPEPVELTVALVLLAVHLQTSASLLA